ncbi:NADPH-dependent F420 reductase [Actinokineospora bangkokensis]|uniref:Ketopantoate reductase N-terminal domain-containing protein n=1 Tax=Actinokineospora bangkokensis TaxID=1193682 RepID=A0A1Q9LJQ4_9PSEU|nr:hypothetical protein BJP25_23450 [Actinokineospora bangkokensis]
MTTIAVIGSGRVGTGLAAAWQRAGHDVVIAARSTRAEAARAADVVVNALPGDIAAEQLAPLADAIGGSVVLDVSNPHSPGPTSVAEQVQAALPRARVVKALNTMLHPVMTAPLPGATAFLSGGDAAAKSTAVDLLADLGWARGSVVDLGGLATARTTESFTALVPAVFTHHAGRPFAFSVVA